MAIDRLTNEKYVFQGSHQAGERLPVKEHWAGTPLQQYVVSELTENGSIDYMYDVNLPGATIWYDYDAGELTRVKVGGPSEEAAAPVVNLGYTESGLLTHKSGACSGCGLGYTDYEYDDHGRLTLTMDANGSTVGRNDYDYSRSLPEITQVSAGPSGSSMVRWRLEYDYDYTGQSYNSLALTRHTYESNGTSRVRIEEYSNQAMGSPTRVYVYADTNPNLSSGTRYETSYDYETNEMTRLTKYYELSPTGLTHASYYNGSTTGDSAGLVTKETLDDGVTEKTITEYGYTTTLNGGNNIVRVAYTVDLRGGSTEYQYTSTNQYTTTGLLTKQISPASDVGRQTYRYQYDCRRRVTKDWQEAEEADWVSATTFYEYDHISNLTRTIEAFEHDTLPEATTEYEYNLFNGQTKLIDSRGFVQTKLYTAAGVLTSEAALRDAEGGSTTQMVSQGRYVYDENGRVTERRAADHPGSFALDSPAGWVTTRYEYDPYGRRTASVEDYGTGRLNLRTEYAYNNQDEVTKTTTPGGVWTETERDGRGLVVKQIIGYAGSTSANQLTTEYAYDAGSNLTFTATPTGITTWHQYDGFGRRTKTIRD